MNFRLSKANALGKRLGELLQYSDGTLGLLRVFGRKPSPYEKIGVVATELDFLRADVLLEDISEITGGVELSLHQLINIVYEDFLVKLRKSEDFSSFLVHLRKMRDDLSTSKRGMELTYVSQDHMSLRPKAADPDSYRLLQLDVPIRRRSAVRGEVLLLDLHRMDPKFRMTLEELMSLLFINLVEKVRQGEQNAIVREILKQLEPSS